MTIAQMPAHTHTFSMNSPPVANNDSGPTLTEDGANGTFNVLTNDTDPDGNPIAPSTVWVSSPWILNTGTPGVQSTFTDLTRPLDFGPGHGHRDVDPANNYNGTAVISHTLTDPLGLADNATITFVVSAVNDSADSRRRHEQHYRRLGPEPHRRQRARERQRSRCRRDGHLTTTAGTFTGARHAGARDRRQLHLHAQ